MPKILDLSIEKRAEVNRVLFEKLSARARRAKFNDDGVLLLDRNNSSDREWYYEDDEE
jgi:hypothetical protein